MTGKADAVRAVSQQFKDRTNTVIEGVMAHLRDDNAKEILGPGLSPLIGRGSLKAIVTFALYADVLRMVRDMVMADGEISDEEVQESLGLLSVLAAGFAKVRKEYASFTQFTPEMARQFLAQYESDAGLFGHGNEATKWAGVELCRNIRSRCGEAGPLEAFGGSLVAWAESIARTDGLDASEQVIVNAIRNIADCSVNLERNSAEAGVSHGRVLTKEIAEQFCSTDSDLDLRKYKAITDEAAAILATCEGRCTLSGLTAISDAAAEALAKHEGHLDLSGLTALSDVAAEALANHEGHLDLSGLTTLSNASKALLAARRDNVFCWGHYNSVLKVCCRLCGTKDEVGIFLHEVNDQTVRYALISAGWYQNIVEEVICPECWGLASLTEKEREAVGGALAGFSGFEEDLSLPGLTTLSDAAAVGFANIRGSLELPGLITISDVAAEAMAKHEGALYLDGLTSLSDAAAKALAKNKGDELSLSGVTALSDVAAEALARYEGDLELDGLAALSDVAAEALAKHEGYLSLSGLTAISDVAAEALAKHGGSLSLSGLTALSDLAAEALAKHEGHLNLSGLTTLSDAAAEALAKHEKLCVRGSVQPLIGKYHK